MFYSAKALRMGITNLIGRALVVVLGIAIGLVLLSEAALAYSVTPLSVKLEGVPGARTSLRVENDKQTALTIEATVMRRLINEDGSEELRPADDDFIVLPPQSIIQPGKVQNLRVQYVGEPLNDGSAHYRIIVAQVPVEFKDGRDSAAAAIVVRFAVGVNLYAPNAGPAKMSTFANLENDGLLVELSTESKNQPISLRGFEYSFRNALGAEHDLNFVKLGDALGASVIPSGSSRRVKLDKSLFPDDFFAAGGPIEFNANRVTGAEE
ncbi:MAG: fimbria/pilus periplasmic chaperone [Pseudomonadota bacterium]